MAAAATSALLQRHVGPQPSHKGPEIDKTVLAILCNDGGKRSD